MADGSDNTSPLAAYRSLSAADRAAVDRQLTASQRAKLRQLVSAKAPASRGAGASPNNGAGSAITGISTSNAKPSDAARAKAIVRSRLSAYSPWLAKRLLEISRSDTAVSEPVRSTILRLLEEPAAAGERS